MDNFEKYYNDSEIINEPIPLREVHAARLMLHAEQKNMTAEEKAARTNVNARAIVEKYGLKIGVVSANQ